jgi:hypothetical protein
MGVPLTPLLSNTLFELGTEEGTFLINNQIHFCIHPLINRLDHSVQNARQHWEIQPFVAEINLHHTKFHLSYKKKSHNLMQLKTDSENSCNQKRTPKTNAQKSVTKPHAVKKAEAITKAKPSTAVTKAHIVTKAKTKTFTVVTKARSHKSLYSRYKSSPVTKPRVSTTYFEASTSTSLIRILGDEDFIVLH